MNFLKKILGVVNQTKHVQHDEHITNFLKSNTHFRKVSFTIFETKKNTLDKLKNSFDDLLRDEDNLKFIEDKKKEIKKNNNNNNNNKANKL